MGLTSELFVSQPVDENFVCDLCWDVMDRPHNACSQGHCFCAPCLATIMGVAAPAVGEAWPSPNPSPNPSRCPSCREALFYPPIVNRILQNIIHTLEVRCPYQGTEEEAAPEPPQRRQRRSSSASNGSGDGGSGSGCSDKKCQWKGKSQDLESHLSTCEFADSKCPLGCGKRFGRSELEAHCAACACRPSQCPTCAVEVLFRDLEAHEATCPDKVVPCQFCAEPMKRGLLGKEPRRNGNGSDPSELDKHYAVCPKIPIHCPYRPAGCYRCVPRDGLSQHFMDCAEPHARLVARNIEDLRGHLDWESVRITWDIEESHLAMGSSAPLSIKSSIINVAGEDLYLNLDLAGQNEPAKIFLKVQNSRWSSVMVDSLYLYVKIDHELALDGALLETADGEAVRLENHGVEGADKSYGGSFMCTRQGPPVNNPGAGEQAEYTFERVNVSRRDLMTGVAGDPRVLSVRCAFRVRKHNNVKLRVRP
jgi:hypothetical protein